MPGVDLVDLELVVGRVAGLDDPLDLAGLVPDDPSEPARVDASRRSRARARLPRSGGLEERREQPGLEERDVAVHDEDLGARPPAARRAPAPTASPVPERLGLESEVGDVGKGLRTVAGSGRVRRRAGGRRSRSGRRRERRRASVGRTGRGGPSGGATSSASRAPRRGRSRRSVAGLVRASSGPRHRRGVPSGVSNVRGGGRRVSRGRCRDRSGRRGRPGTRQPRTGAK